jgi:ATP adenylyltransferase
MTYIGGIDKEKEEGCFFCNAWRGVGAEKEHLVLGRGRSAFVMLNRYPYTNGHLMIAPAAHEGRMEDVDADVGAEMWRLAVVAKKTLSAAMRPQGFNVGINQGRVAGAGVVDHLHMHIVPRWDGDNNFMPVLGDVRVIPQALEETWAILSPIMTELLKG